VLLVHVGIMAAVYYCYATSGFSLDEQAKEAGNYHEAKNIVEGSTTVNLDITAFKFISVSKDI